LNAIRSNPEGTVLVGVPKYQKTEDLMEKFEVHWVR
jgi:hypothetical protein